MVYKDDARGCIFDGQGEYGFRWFDPDVIAFHVHTVAYMAHENLHV
jgi:hypothetical protein